MKKYEKLEILSYQRVDVDDEYKKRINNPTTLLTNLEISPINRDGLRDYSKRYNLFYVPIPEINILQSKIAQNNYFINALSNDISKVGYKSFLKDIMLSEINRSNHIEGVYSTKKELSENIKDGKVKNSNNYYGIVNCYFDLLNSKFFEMENIEDFRNLYEYMFSMDILQNDSNKLDGELFRTDYVFIKSASNKIVHTGDKNEMEIKENLNKLIFFINSFEVPFEIKACIIHYFFEYIHPFYDGNGRIGRFIFSNYLAKYTHIMTALSLSYAISENKNKYLKLFKEVSKIENKGELTFFVKGMLEMILSGQESIIEKLQSGKMKSDNAKRIVDSFILDDKDKDVLLTILDINIFSDNYASMDEIKEFVVLTKQTISKKLKKLENDCYISKVSSKPYMVKFNVDLLDNK